MARKYKQFGKRDKTGHVVERPEIDVFGNLTRGVPQSYYSLPETPEIVVAINAGNIDRVPILDKMQVKYYEQNPKAKPKPKAPAPEKKAADEPKK